MANTSKVIDLNCDLGEGHEDEKLFPYISSCNIASGGHYGDRDSIKKTIIAALKNDVSIGIHPGYPDKENFGRISLDLPLQDLKFSLEKQIELFINVCDEIGTKPTHVKPHGALYNDLASDYNLSLETLSTINKLLPDIIIYGLAHSATHQAAQQLDIKCINEVFADRTYTKEKKLVSRKKEGSVISDWPQMKTQIDGLLKGEISTIEGEKISLKAQSICLHGDSPNAAANSKRIYEYVKAQDYAIRSYS